MALINTINRDSFRGELLSPEELQRRLALLIEQIYNLMQQIIEEVEA